MDTFFAKLMDGFNTLPASRKMTLAAVAVIVALSIGAFVWVTNQEDYRVLFSNLSSGDAANILIKLKEKKVPYQISAAGDIISVPAAQVSELRLELAAGGIPQGGGVGFEIFDNKTFGTTDFEKQLNYRRALQGELARTINSLDEIQQSRVHIVLPKDSLFVDQQKKTTASVTIRLKPGKKLKPSQIDGIGHLVASSVEGLNAADVMVVDSQGNILSQNSGDSRLAQMTTSQVEHKKNIEKDMAGKIQTMLENIVGPGKAAVRVSADLDFRIMEKTEELYDPESPVIRSTQKQIDKATGPIPVPGKTAAPAALAGPEKEKSEETVNFEINRVVSKTVMPVGEVKKLSIAVLVDGIYNKDSKGTLIYQDRPKKDIDALEDLVRKSAGLDTQRGDQVIVSSMPFNRPEAEQGMTSLPWQDRLAPFFPIIKYIVTLIALVLIIFFVIKPLMQSLTAASLRIGTGKLAAPSIGRSGGVSVELSSQPTPLAIGGLEDGSLTEVEMARQMAALNSKKFAELLRNWLK
ncbi:MAG: flagellar basal-body MS-ring/collar protein FliF [Pseudomonadota bacterium]